MIMVLVEITLKAEQFDQRDVISSALPDTVAYEGCLGLEACSNREESNPALRSLLLYLRFWH